MQFSILKMLEEAVEEHFELFFVALVAIVTGAVITLKDENAEVVEKLCEIDNGLMSIALRRSASDYRGFITDENERDDCFSFEEERLCNQRQEVMKEFFGEDKAELNRQVAAARGFSL